MRLSTAAQISTIHNPAGRVGVGNLLKGINDQIRKPENRRHLEDLGVMNTEMAEVSHVKRPVCKPRKPWV